MPPTLQLKSLEHVDVDAAMALSTQAGWNQLPADWHRLVDLWPEGCLAGVAEGRVVATATLAMYGRQLGWVGMVLVDAACRKRGYGMMMLEAILERGEALGCRRLGLDATEFGRPLYLKQGFTDGPAVHRMIAENGVQGVTQGMGDPLESQDWPALLALDRAACGIDRTRLLEHLRDDPDARFHVARHGGKLAGFAVLTPGRLAAAIGPVVAQTVEPGPLVAGLLAGVNGPVMADIPAASPLAPWLMAHGFTVSRELVRMLRGPGNETLLGSNVAGVTNFALG